MKSLLEQIQQLSSAKAIESAKIVASSIAGSDDSLLTEEDFKKEFGDPLSHIDDIDQLARILLINAAQDPKYVTLVQNAIDNSGKKQLVLGGAEIVALGILGIAALRIIINPKNQEDFEYTDKDGNKVKRKVTYNNDTSFLTKIFQKYFS